MGHAFSGLAHILLLWSHIHALAPLVTPIMSELNPTYAQMGAVTGAWQLTYVFSAQPLGLLVDLIGVHRSLLLGTLIMATSSILRSFASGFESLFVSVALFGMGEPMVSIGTPKLVSVWFAGRERGTASGINVCGSSVSSIAALGLTNSMIPSNRRELEKRLSRLRSLRFRRCAHMAHVWCKEPAAKE